MQRDALVARFANARSLVALAVPAAQRFDAAGAGRGLGAAGGALARHPPLRAVGPRLQVIVPA